jgi:diacylglycerol kinase family enzyme
LAVLPTGSANNIARTLGLMEYDVAALVASWQAGIHRRFGLSRITASQGEALFVEAAGGGFFSDILHRADAIKTTPDRPAKLLRGLQLLEATLAVAPVRRWNLRVDGTEASGEHIAVELMRIREIGPHLALAADADPSTDQFQVVTIRPEDREQLAAWRRTQSEGAPPISLRLPTWTGSSVEFDPPDGCRIHLDDELWDHNPGSSATGKLQAAAGVVWIDLLVPAARHSAP